MTDDERAHAGHMLSSTLCRRGFTQWDPAARCPACSILDDLERARAELAEARAEVARLSGLVNSPELHDFAKAVALEAAHQRERWGTEHDEGKAPEDWFWLLGYLAGKALHAAKAGDRDKALHHTISSAAALANWHAHITGVSTEMRPGIEPPVEESACE